MRKTIFAVAAAFIAMLATPAHAQTRTWVSGVGDDVNPCSRTAPCKTFAGAISKTAAGGEINCLDPGGFGAVTITKSITIDCRWTHGSILAANTNGVIINDGATATPGTIVVVLRGITINGANTTTGNGVRIIQALAVTLDDVVIENIQGALPSNGRGVSIEDGNAVRVAIIDSRFVNINGPAIHSIPSGGLVTLDVSNVNIQRGGTNGIQLRQNTNASIDEVVITNHASGAGVVLETNSATAVVSDSVLSNNAFGVISGTGGGTPILRISGNVITNNTSAGLSIGAGAQVISNGTNTIRGNIGNETPSTTLGPT